MQNYIHHDNAVNHITGKSVYINDINFNNQLLIGKVIYSKHAHAKIKKIDVKKAKQVSGVKAIITYKDIPGKNQMGPVIHDELCLAINEVTFVGQAIILIAAETSEAINEAEKLIVIEYETLEAVVTLEDAIKKNNLISSPRKITTGNFEKEFKSSKNKFEGKLYINGQEHWYLETQTALAVPSENNEIKIYASSQNPTETQAIVAEVLGLKLNQVEVEVKRLGGGFGGKETQGNHIAAWAALLSHYTKQPVKIHLFRDDDQIITGKRHRCIANYKVAFDNKGKITAYFVEINLDAGSATDLSMAILERSMLHAENAYYIPNVTIIGKAFKTNLPSNTAFRGFGGPQGMAIIENAIDIIARKLNIESSKIRKINFYKSRKYNITPYGQIIKNNRLNILFKQLISSSKYYNKIKEINKFNNSNKYIKRGIAITPVKFGISFTTSFLNQAGALVNVYTDGTVLVNHGGTEMGQGINTKILQVAASEFGISTDKIIVNATNTSKVPNTSPTAASSGSDLNGMAVKNAIDKIKKTMSKVAFEELKKDNKNVLIKNIIFENGFVFDKKYSKNKIPFSELANITRIKQYSLSATGYYKTPNIYFDKQNGKGNPFYYFAYGMAVSEVEVDILTGKYKVLQSNILHDVGSSINSELDKGQVVGGFIQGLGWVTSEELKWDKNGNLLSHSPDTYKIPTINDIPHVLNVNLLKGYPNNGVIHQSKAVGEPPLMLALSVWLAIKFAISSVCNHKYEPDFSLPMTSEQVLLSIEKIKILK